MTDRDGFVVDSTGDGGDSANFTCTKIWLGGYQQSPELARKLLDGFWNQGQTQWRVFDYADPVTPDFLGLMIVKGEMKELEWFLPLARWSCRRSIAAHCKLAKDPNYNDFKQLYITSKYLNVHKEFLRNHPRGLAEASRLYFTGWRGLQDLHELFLQEFDREIKNPSM